MSSWLLFGGLYQPCTRINHTMYVLCLFFSPKYFSALPSWTFSQWDHNGSKLLLFCIIVLVSFMLWLHFAWVFFWGGVVNKQVGPSKTDSKYLPTYARSGLLLYTFQTNVHGRMMNKTSYINSTSSLIFNAISRALEWSLKSCVPGFKNTSVACPFFTKTCVHFSLFQCPCQNLVFLTVSVFHVPLSCTGPNKNSGGYQ